MSIHLALIDLDQLFHNSSTTPIIVNDIDTSRREEKETLNSHIYTNYSGDALDIVPSCECGETRGRFNLGVKCKVCSTEVASNTDRKLESLLWITTPKGIDTLFNPDAWTLLTRILTVGHLNLLQYLTDPVYTPPTSAMKTLKTLLGQQPKLGEIKRSYNHFTRNFFEIMEFLFTIRGIRNTEARRREVFAFLEDNKDKIFCKYIPFPSKVGFVTENSPVGTFVDLAITPAVDAIRTITSISTSITPLTPRYLEFRVVKALNSLAEFYTNFIKGAMGGKPGLLRKHVFGGRLHFSGRAVISSIIEPHEYDELHIPWGLAVQIFELHLSNKLLRRGYSARQIVEIFYQNTNKSCDLLADLFEEIIRESPHKGFPCLFQRNPSLVRGSAQLFYITKVKRDVENRTISLSTLVLKAPNADFDGDELNMLLILDEYTHDRLYPLAPHKGALALDVPHSISSNLGIGAPVLNTANHWLSGTD